MSKNKTTAIGQQSIEKFMDIHGIDGTWEILDKLTKANQALLFADKDNADEVMGIIDCQLLIMDVMREHYGIEIE